MTTTVDDLRQWREQLDVFDPASNVWKKAAKELTAFGIEFEANLKVKKDRKAVDDVRSIIPDDVKEELESISISKFPLGIIFHQAYREYNQIYRNFTHEYGKELSMQARQSMNEFDTTSYVYGEISFFPFADILYSTFDNLSPNNSVFYDLGSGVGKAVLAASLLFPFHKAKGIEQLKPLVDFSHARVDKLLEFNDVAGQTISFVCGSFFDHPWDDGDVVFCHSTCFSPTMWTKISKDAEKLKQGAYFISVSHILESPLFEVLETKTLTMSWGTCTVYIQRRRRIGRWASQLLTGNASRSDLARSHSNKENEYRK